MRAFARSHPILAGAGIGFGWGIAMRLWMRFISTSPEFSWGGTLMILGVSAAVGALLGFARLRRARHGVGWWRFTALSLLLLGAAGAAMWPAVILGSIAIGRRRPVWLVSLLGAAALATQWPVIADNIVNNSTMGLAEQTLGVAWYLPMLTLQTWGFSVAFAPSLAKAAAPARLKTALIGVPLAGFAVAAVLTGHVGM